MPPKGCPATASGYRYCSHCNSYISRSSFWRHNREPLTEEALAAGLNLPPESDPEPNSVLPSSPPLGDISITSMEQALSDLDEEDLAVLGVEFQLPTPRVESPDEDIQDLSMLYEDLELEEEEDLQGDHDISEEEGIPRLAIRGEYIDDDDSNNIFDLRDDWDQAVGSQHEVDGDDRHEMEIDGDPPFGDFSSGDGGAAMDLSLFWEGLPGGANRNAVDDRDEDEEGDILVGTVVDGPKGSVSSRLSTPSTAHSNPSEPPTSPHPELVRIWDLQAARHHKSCIPCYPCWPRFANFCSGVSEGIPEGSDTWTAIKTYKLQMEVNLGANAYQKFRATFSNLELPSLKTLRREMYDLCGIEPTLFDCCKNSCMCFSGPYAPLTTCIYCQHDHFKPNGQSYNQFHYLPLIPQAKALYAGKTSATAMRYRSIHEFDNLLEDDSPITDIYDSVLYQKLRESRIEVNRHTLQERYLEDPRDVLLTGLTDGFQLFRHGKHTAWPLLFINNNLSPLERYKVGNCICGGLIPGPRKPKDHDSFTFVVIQELLKAALGVDAYDTFADELFKLRIFCPWKCGDMPAAASACTGGKNHGAIHPCRMCPIEGIRIAGSSNLNHYIPITRPAGYPASQGHRRSAYSG